MSLEEMSYEVRARAGARLRKGDLIIPSDVRAMSTAVLMHVLDEHRVYICGLVDSEGDIKRVTVWYNPFTSYRDLLRTKKGQLIAGAYILDVVPAGQSREVAQNWRRSFGGDEKRSTRRVYQRNYNLRTGRTKRSYVQEQLASEEGQPDKWDEWAEKIERGVQEIEQKRWEERPAECPNCGSRNARYGDGDSVVCYTCLERAPHN